MEPQCSLTVEANQGGKYGLANTDCKTGNGPTTGSVLQQRFQIRQVNLMTCSEFTGGLRNFLDSHNNEFGWIGNKLSISICAHLDEGLYVVHPNT